MNRLLIALLFMANICLAQENSSTVIEQGGNIKTKRLKTVKIKKSRKAIIASGKEEENAIFKPGRVFIYNYVIIDSANSFKLNRNFDNEFVFIADKSDSIKIKNIRFTVVQQNVYRKPGKNPRKIQVSYEPDFASAGIETTVFVENNDNIGIHPPRSGFFNSLESCPFPYIKLPPKIGNSWRDELSVKDQWANQAWGSWKGSMQIKYNYKITSQEDVTTDFGKIDCYVINSVAYSSIGTSSLVSYFSTEYGFVKLEYTLYNGKKVIITMQKAEVEKSDADVIPVKKRKMLGFLRP